MLQNAPNRTIFKKKFGGACPRTPLTIALLRHAPQDASRHATRPDPPPKIPPPPPSLILPMPMTQLLSKFLYQTTLNVLEILLILKKLVKFYMST